MLTREGLPLQKKLVREGGGEGGMTV